MKFSKIPTATITRLSIYSRYLEALAQEGVKIIASDKLAQKCGINPAQIRKDLSHFGEFGKLEKAAVIDSIGVHPAYGGSGIGHALLSQLLLNLSTLKVESVVVQVSHENFGLHRFLHARGFVPSQRLVLTKCLDS